MSSEKHRFTLYYIFRDAGGKETICFEDIYRNQSGQFAVSRDITIIAGASPFKFIVQGLDREIMRDAQQMNIVCKEHNDEEVKRAFDEYCKLESKVVEREDKRDPIASLSKYLEYVINHFYVWYDEKDFPIEWKKEGEFRHSSDFRTVNFKGKEYHLTLQQSVVIQRLYENYKRGTPELSQHYILEELDRFSGKETSIGRLRDVFKTNMDAWRELISPGERKGTFRLSL